MPRIASTETLIPKSLPPEVNASLRQGVWQEFAKRRFDDLARGLERYGELGRKGRIAWLQQGEHRELAAEEALTLDAGAHLFMLAGTAELAHAGGRTTVRGSVLVHAESPLRVVARESARLVVVPPEARQ